MKNIESDIQARVDAFVEELTEMIRTAAMESIRETLLGELSATPKRKPGRPRKAKKKAKKVVRRAKAAKPAKRGKRIRRSSELVSQIGEKIFAHVKAHPGLRLGEIARAIGVETKDARRPAFVLVEAKKLKTTGQRGGTRYFATGAKTAGAAKKASKKKAKKRKTAKRKASKK